MLWTRRKTHDQPLDSVRVDDRHPDITPRTLAEFRRLCRLMRQLGATGDVRPTAYCAALLLDGWGRTEAREEAERVFGRHDEH